MFRFVIGIVYVNTMLLWAGLPLKKIPVIIKIGALKVALLYFMTVLISRLRYYFIESCSNIDFLRLVLGLKNAT